MKKKIRLSAKKSVAQKSVAQKSVAQKSVAQKSVTQKFAHHSNLTPITIPGLQLDLELSKPWS